MKKLLRSRIFFSVAIFSVILLISFLVKKSPSHKDKITLNENTSKLEYSHDQKTKIIHRKTAILKPTCIPKPTTIIKEIDTTPSTIKLPEAAYYDYSHSNEASASSNKKNHSIIIYSNPENVSKPESLKTKKSPTLPQTFAPFGRLIKCELVNTIDSGPSESPIIGLVTDPVYWNGHLIIPAGSEVHGYTEAKALRDRIISKKEWRIVLPEENRRVNGMVLELKAISLDQEISDGSNRTFGITDGSYGIKGERLQSCQLEELKVFGAVFAGTLASGLQASEPLGDTGLSTIKKTPRDAALGGLTAIMDRYAQTLEKQVLENAFFTRVIAGKQFYLYVEQLINPEAWELEISNHEKT